GQVVDVGQFGEGAAAGAEPVEGWVLLSQVKEGLLCVRCGFHPYPRCAVVVQASVTLSETRASTLLPVAARAWVSRSAASVSQGHSVAQWAASMRAGPSSSAYSLAGWWRRSAVR